MEQERWCVMCWHPSPPDAWRRAIPDGCHGPFATIEAADEWRLARLIEAGEIDRCAGGYRIDCGDVVASSDALEWWDIYAQRVSSCIQCNAVRYYEYTEAAKAGDASTEASE